MDFTFHEVASICNGDILQGNPDSLISQVITDSRRILNPNNVVFVALKGPTFNGHQFIIQCIEKGIRSFIVSEDLDEMPDDIEIIKVGNTIDALQHIAAAHRSKFSFPVIGITGSNGKTILKEWINQCLYEDYQIVRSPKSYNSQVGVPLSVLLMEKSKNLGIFEVGMSVPGEIEKLEQIVKPDVGVLTNIGNAHSENFDDLESKAEEKAHLFKKCKAIIYCADDQLVSSVLSKYHESLHFNWSLNEVGKVNFSRIKDMNSNRFKASSKRGKFEFIIPFSDEASIQNCLHLVTILIYFDVSFQQISSRVSGLKKVGMRLETVEGMYNSLLINDVYNSDLTSLETALDMLDEEPNFDKKHLVLSEMGHTGLSNTALINRVRELVKNISLDSIHYVGEKAIESKPIISEDPTYYYNNTDDFIKQIDTRLFKDSAVLIKGERKFEFERITHHLQRKTHDTVLEINLRALRENLNYYRKLLNPGVKIAVMVKAFSYGSGLHEIAAALQNHNIHYLAVAYADEGIELRERKIHLPIMVMNPENSSPSVFEQYNLEPVIFSSGLIDRFLEDGSMPIHLKFDTGMNRLGFGLVDVEEIIEKCKHHSHRIASVFTHLAASDESLHDDFTTAQLKRFETIKKTFTDAFGGQIIFHALNSAGISRFSKYQYNMVRLGIGLYGYSFNKEDLKFLQPVLRLKSIISQVKRVNEGDSIGYSRSFVAPRLMTIGIVPIGYADGIHRTFGNGNGSVMIHGNTCKVVGNICMDMCMIDISGLGIKEGAEVEFFGENKPLQDTADEMGTIAYEVLANISQRVKRRFYSD